MKQFDQKGAVDFMFIAVLIIVVAVGGFVFWRLQATDETVSDTEQATIESNSDIAATQYPRDNNVTNNGIAVAKPGKLLEDTGNSRTAINPGKYYSDDYSFTIDLPVGSVSVGYPDSGKIGNLKFSFSFNQVLNGPVFALFVQSEAIESVISEASIAADNSEILEINTVSKFNLDNVTEIIRRNTVNAQVSRIYVFLSGDEVIKVIGTVDNSSDEFIDAINKVVDSLSFY